MTEQIATLLYTDIVNSTALNARWGDDVMARVWQSHDNAARALMRASEGREVGRSDGFLATFPDASRAVEFAVSYHRCLASFEPPLEARVGIHVGPIRWRENSPEDTEQGAPRFDIDGVALAVVSRIMSVAIGRQTLLSESALRALGPTRLHTKSHGHWRLKGLSEPVELIEVGGPTAPYVPPPDSTKAYRVALIDDGWMSVAELPNSLPAERDTFIGRLGELQALSDLFNDDTRLVTLLGIGGIGKTRLAVRYARSWLGDYPGGAWFCDLSAARALEGVIQAVAHDLDVPLGKADPVEQLGSAIAGRGQCLVILDNFEQVARHAEEIVGRWLERAPQAKFIVTSREVLGIAGEQTLVLGPLANSEATEMFRKRLRAVGHRAPLGAADEEAISPLVDLLDRLPLAIELAAARTRVMPPRLLLQRMGERFKLLATRGGRRDRQATLRATLDWSWDLLSPAEQLALAQISVFEAGFNLAAAEAVIDVSTTDPGAEPTALVQALLEKSLVIQREGDRFDLLSTVQEYAAQHLKVLEEGHDELSSAQRRHGEYFATLDPRDTATLCSERANLVVAARRAAATAQPHTAIAALERAWTAFKLRGPFRAALELAETVRSTVGLDEAGAARIDRIAAWSLKASGHPSDAETRLVDALDSAKTANDRECEGQIHWLLGDVRLNLGLVGQARDDYELALHIADELGNLALACEAHAGLGNLCREVGNAAEAQLHYEAALGAARELGDRRWEGGSLGNLGTVCIDQGDKTQAEKHFLSALGIAREIGDQQFEANTLCNLGLMHQEQGKLDLAQQELKAALLATRELGHTRLESVVLCNLGIVLDSAASPVEAREHYEAALEIARSQGDRRTEGQVLGYVGLLHCRMGRFAEGRACLQAGVMRLMEVSDQAGLAILHCGRAEGEFLAGDRSAAAAALVSAEMIAKSLGATADTELGMALARARALDAEARA